ncbi:MAG: hypothetical protein VX464_11740 [Pseudomonadota bacterium]|nr:hypothetical protein [Pseudomonadota bacterium]
MVGVHDLKRMGRGGDDTLAHLDTREVVVPKDVQSPGLMRALAAAFERAELPMERYVVGHVDNSINPATGLQEFRGGGVGPGEGTGPGGNNAGGGGNNSGDNSASAGHGEKGVHSSERGLANAGAMGGNKGSLGGPGLSPTPLQDPVFGLTNTPYGTPEDVAPEVGSVAANYGFAPTARQKALSTAMGLLGFGFLDADPAPFSDDDVDVSFSPIAGILGNLSPDLGTLSGLSGLADGPTLGDIDAALGTAIGLGTVSAPNVGLQGSFGVEAPNPESDPGSQIAQGVRGVVAPSRSPAQTAGLSSQRSALADALSGPGFTRANRGVVYF